MHNKAMEMAKHAMTDACTKGYDCMTSQDWDDFKDCIETAKNAIECDYYYRLVECMKKDKEEEEREDKYFLDMLKEEHKDEYRRMRDEYGEDEGERRFYDNYRYKSSGRFAPKGSGSYMPRRSGRRGYEEMPYMHMCPEMYDGMTPEEMRDMDLDMNRMYYSGGRPAPRMQRANSTSTGRSADIRGYEDGYRDGEMAGRSMQTRDHREGRSGMSRRTYMETKEMHKGNTAEEKQMKMKDLEAYMKDIAEDISEAIGGASNEERTLIKAKLQTMATKI